MVAYMVGDGGCRGCCGHSGGFLAGFVVGNNDVVVLGGNLLAFGNGG